MQVTGNTITVTGLSYTRNYTVTVMAVVCPGIETNSEPILISFSTEGILLIQSTVSQCKARVREGFYCPTHSESVWPQT